MSINTKPRREKPLSPFELAAFCTQIALTLKAGIPLQESISILAQESGNAAGAPVLQVLLSHTESGEPFSEGLRQAGVFPQYMVEMAQIGEQSGRLDEVMQSLADYYERMDAVRRNIKNAVAYPALMIAMMLVVIGVLVVKVLPVFNEVFIQLGSEMSAFSQGVMHLGTLLSRYALVILLLAAVLAAAGALLARSDWGKAHMRFLLRGVAGKTATSRFASAMSMMLRSGLDVDEALDMARALLAGGEGEEKIAACQKKMADGTPFPEALSTTGLFPGVYARMVAVGFKTGTVDAMMEKIAVLCGNELDERMDRIIAVLEPTLVAVLSIVVGGILLSVMMPLMGIMSSIG